MDQTIKTHGEFTVHRFVQLQGPGLIDRERDAIQGGFQPARGFGNIVEISHRQLHATCTGADHEACNALTVKQSFGLPPAVTVHGRDDVRHALSLGRPLTLLSGIGAASYAGCGWWRALVDSLGTDAPPDLLDCADASGRALEALRYGQKRLVLYPSAVAHARIVEAAAAVGATVLSERPSSIDFADPRARRQLKAWLDDSLTGIG